MSRTARIKSGTDMYHIMARGLNKESIFSGKRAKERMFEFIRENISCCDVEIYAYCIMENHLHLLIKSELKELSKFMAKVLAAYTQYYNYKNGRIGYVFQDRYKSECVETEKTYKYSSFHEYCQWRQELLHDKAFSFYQMRFQKNAAFLAFHKEKEVDVFEDVEEEKSCQQRLVAEYLLKKEAEKLEFLESEVLAIGENRTKFRKSLQEMLHLSQKEAYQILDYLKGVLKESSN